MNSCPLAETRSIKAARGRSSTRRRRWCRGRGKCVIVDRASDDHALHVAHHVIPADCWPHHRMGTLQIKGSSPKIERQSGAMKPSNASVSTSPLPSAFAMTTLPDRATWASLARQSWSVRSSGSRTSVSRSAGKQIDRAQTLDGLEVQAVVAHRQVTLGQGEAKVAGKIGVLEVVLPRRSGSAPRPARRRAGQADQMLSSTGRTSPLAADTIRQASGGDDTGFQRVSRTGRCLRPVAQHPPLPVLTPSQIERDEMEVGAPERLYTVGAL